VKILLTALRASSEQQDQLVSVASEVDAIPRPAVDAALHHAVSDALAVAQISQAHARDGIVYELASTGIEAEEPLCEEARGPSFRYVLANLDHVSMITYTLLQEQPTIAAGVALESDAPHGRITNARPTNDYGAAARRREELGETLLQHSTKVDVGNNHMHNQSKSDLLPTCPDGFPRS
jgi:hypothetical protein